MTTTTVGYGKTFASPVGAGDTVNVSLGGTTTNVLLGGTENVYPGGTAKGTTVQKGGKLSNGGTVSGGTVQAGGVVNNSSGGSVSNMTILGQLNERGSGSGNTVGTGGHLVVAAGGSEANVTLAGGTLDATALGASVTGNLTLSGTGNELDLSGLNRSPATIVGLSGSDKIDISNLDVTSETVSGNTVTFHLRTGGSYTLSIEGASTSGLTFAPDHNGGETIGSRAPTCFLAGTAIATPDGVRAIETLAAGDLVLATDGTAHEVRWLGRQTLAMRFADRLRAAPIRIRAGALGEGLPARDLLLSNDHAVMVDGVFAQAGALVNGISIVREDAGMPEMLVYFHVELATHQLILAEGVAAETFIDNVDRLAFDNWSERLAPEADAAPMAEMPHARAKSHRQVPRSLRARLLARGVSLFGGSAEAA